MRNPFTCIGTEWAKLLALGLLFAGCGEEKPEEKEDREIYVPPTPPPARVKAGVEYTDMARAAGIDFRHISGAQPPPEGQKLLPETMGSGVAVFDYEGDGDQDLLFVQSRPWKGEASAHPTMRLYRNDTKDGTWRFTDITKEAGLEIPCYGQGVAVGDYDADGDPDLYITCLGPSFLLRNDGGRYVRVEGGPDGGTWTDDKGRVHSSWSTGAAWFDADEDGDLDLIVINYVHWTKETDLYTSVSGEEKSYTRPQLFDGDFTRLYLQQEGGIFEDATARSGLRIVQPKKGAPYAADTLAPIPGAKDLAKSLALCLDDYNADGHIDVFVGNDTVQNLLFLGRGDGTFSQVARDALVAFDSQGTARAAMGADSAMFDQRLAIAVTNFADEPVSFFTTAPKPGTPVFRDDANSAKIGTATLVKLAFGIRFLDADLDGFTDLVVVNGHIEPSVSRIRQELRYEQTAQMFRRDPKGRGFADVSVQSGEPFRRPVVGRGLAFGDLDGDGDLDLVITVNGGVAGAAPLVLRAEPLDKKNRSLRLRLRMKEGGNRDALGAQVTVQTGERTQRSLVRTGGSYLSQSELWLTFGLGHAAKAGPIRIRWPDGHEQTIAELSAGAHTIER